GDLPGFNPAMIAIDGLVATDLGVLEIDRLLLVDEQLDVVFERALIAFEGEDVIGFLIDDRLRDVALTAHRVDSHDRPLELQHAQELGDGDDLVGLLRHLDLTENQTLSCGESRHDVESDPWGSSSSWRSSNRTGARSCRRWRPLRPEPPFA